jgi:DNA-binding MarR family transcriptional regulator
MVVALFTTNAGLDRARRRIKGAGTLRLLQIVAGRDGIRPSEIADLLEVHPSLVTRQVQELEAGGYVQVAEDPADRRSCHIELTTMGVHELRRLEQVGLERFAEFVADWEPSEVRTFTALLEKLETSKAAVAARERALAAQSPESGARTRGRRGKLAIAREPL